MNRFILRIKADDFCDLYAGAVGFSALLGGFFMNTSIAMILLSGMFLGFLSKKAKLPSLVGMILAGIIIGPYFLGLIDSSLLGIAADLRQIALVIILTRAGLSLDFNELKKAGRPALLMCFLPAVMEICGTVIIAPRLFDVSLLEAALIGSVTAAVSPAVVVPRMINLINEGRGTDRQIPQMILAGASADDVFAIVMFTSFTALLSGGSASASDIVQIPMSILLGIAAGIAVGLVLCAFFGKVHIRDSSKVIILMSTAFLLIALENASEEYIRISGLIAVMTVGMTIFAKRKELAKRLSAKFNKLWVCAEIMLFVLVGTAVIPESVTAYGIRVVILILGAMVFRMAGVFLCLIRTSLNIKERLFCMLAYTPKATVQAAIGAIPLSMGLPCGELVLSAAVIAIIVTAPFGAFMIDRTGSRLLSSE